MPPAPSRRYHSILSSVSGPSTSFALIVPNLIYVRHVGDRPTLRGEVEAQGLTLQQVLLVRDACLELSSPHVVGHGPAHIISDPVPHNPRLLDSPIQRFGRILAQDLGRVFRRPSLPLDFRFESAQVLLLARTA